MRSADGHEPRRRRAGGVVSFGGLPLVLLVPAGILVTHVPSRDLGLRAATMLMERIQGLDAPAREKILPVGTSDEDSDLSQLDGHARVLDVRVTLRPAQDRPSCARPGRSILWPWTRRPWAS